MVDLFRTCPDGHRCEHNSLCVAAEEGSYYCDCGTSTGDYAGLSCEFAAEDYCVSADESMSTWCTNNGLCELSSSNTWYCDCPPEYDGPHCEYIAGARPDNWPGMEATVTTSKGAKKSDGLAGGVMAVIIIVSIIVGAMMAILVRRSIRRRRDMELDTATEPVMFRKAGQNAPKDHSEALNIEMDGTGFRDAVISGKSNTGEEYDFDADSVEVDPEMDAAKASISATHDHDSSNGHGMML